MWISAAAETAQQFLPRRSLCRIPGASVKPGSFMLHALIYCIKFMCCPDHLNQFLLDDECCRWCLDTTPWPSHPMWYVCNNGMTAINTVELIGFLFHLFPIKKKYDGFISLHSWSWKSMGKSHLKKYYKLKKIIKFRYTPSNMWWSLDTIISIASFPTEIELPIHASFLGCKTLSLDSVVAPGVFQNLKIIFVKRVHRTVD